MIKKFLILIIIVSLLSACATSLNPDKNALDNNDEDKKEAEVQLPVYDTSPANFTNEYKTILMENLEESEVLLYEKLAFTWIEFSVRNKTSFSAGKDIFSFAYLSKAEPKDIYNAYLAYIDNVAEEWQSEYSLDIKGTVKGLPISVSVELSGLIDLEGYPVRITISEDPEKFEEENRYFHEYPDLVELYKVDKDSSIHHKEDSYLESYLDGLKTYKFVFKTKANEDDFTSYYTENYSDKVNFEFKEDEYQLELSWSDSGFEHKILFQKSNNQVALYVVGPLP